MIRVSPADFDCGAEIARLRNNAENAGALVTFSGLVRGFSESADISAIFIEHYPEMTEKQLRSIAEEAMRRWQVKDYTIIHRVGELAASEQIVFVGVAAEHRHSAFAAAEFIMDYLKTRAPFWKKEITSDGERWLEMKQSDREAAQQWQGDQ